MGTVKVSGDLSAPLKGAQRRFERWRRTRKPKSRIPESLWACAVQAARRDGVHRTAKALSLDYYSLKKRVEEKPAAAAQAPKRSANTVAASPEWIRTTNLRLRRRVDESRKPKRE